jgi:hypothetical protein
VKSHLRSSSPAWQLSCCLPAHALIVAIAASATLACRAGETDRETSRDTATTTVASESAASASRPSWYRKARALDLTGDGQLDSVRLDAVGVQPDSLRITLRLIVSGSEKHREEWGSSYELALVDTSRGAGPQVAALLRAQLDSVLASVRVERLDAPSVRLMAEDSAILRGLDPPPTHRISFAYGYETTIRLVWDAPRERFVPLWSCC